MVLKVTQQWKSFPQSFKQTVTNSAPTGYTVFVPYTWSNSRNGNPYPRPPGWKAAVKAGANATTSLAATKTDLRATRGMAFRTLYNETANPKPPPPYADVMQEWEGYNCLPAVVPNTAYFNPAALSKARNQAMVRLVQQLKAQRTHFDGITFAGEARESTKLILSASKFLAETVPNYMSGQKKTIAKWVGTFIVDPLTGNPVRVKDEARYKRVKANATQWEAFRKELYDRYLAWAFGVKPLLNDVKGAAETFARFQHDSRHTEIRGYGKAYVDKTVTRSSGTLSGGLSTVTISRTEAYVEVIMRAGLRFELDSPAFGSARRAQELAGFTLESFVPSMWNLLPFSFLTDYFLNVGDILECMFTDTSAIRWLNQTERASAVKFGDMYVDANRGNVVGNVLGSYEASFRSINRFIPSLSFIPDVQLTVPGGDSLKWLNIAALMGNGSFKSRYGGLL